MWKNGGIIILWWNVIKTFLRSPDLQKAFCPDTLYIKIFLYYIIFAY